MSQLYKDVVSSRVYNHLKGKDFEAMLSIFADELDSAQDVLESVKLLADIENQSGIWLDLIGKIIGLPRGLSNEALADLFGFGNEAGDPLPVSGFGTLSDPDVGGFFNGLNPIDVGLQGDPEYRTFLLAKAYANGSDCDIESIATHAKLVTGLDDIQVDDGNLTVTISSLAGTITGTQRIAILQTSPRAAGIKVEVI